MNATTSCSYSNAIHWDKTGSVGSFQPLASNDPNGTAFQFASSSCTTIYGYSTSTDQSVVNGFTAGEIVLAVQLFLLLAVAMTILYHVMFRRFKIKNP
jgi:hypothetical protein